MSRSAVKLALIGAGKMGGSLLAGWLDLGLDPQSIFVFDPQPSSELCELCARSGVRLNPDHASIAPPEAVVIAIKPQAFQQAAPAFRDLAGPGALVLSIMAGKRIADLRRALPDCGAIVRAMPNTPAAVRKGIAGVVGEPGLSDERHRLAGDLLSAVGAVEWLTEESQIDAVTAVSGSGPAYVFYLVECLASAGVAVGLPPPVALRLARATVEGAGALLESAPDLAPGDLRRNVTSPGGTTAAALELLAGPDGLEPLMKRAVEAACKRAEELSG